MKTYNIFFSLLCFLLAFSACKKETRRNPNTTVTGTVIDFKTKLPIANATVTLKRYKNRYSFNQLMGGGGTTKTIKIKSVNTDGNGVFTLTFYEDSNRSYGLSVEADGYGGPVSKTLYQLISEGNIVYMRAY